MYNIETIKQTMFEIFDESKQIKPYVVFCSPRRNLDEIPAQELNHAHKMHIDVMGYSHAYGNVGGEKVDVARNYLIEEAINSGAKYMFFVGEDTVIPKNGFTLLHETALKNPNSIIVGVYWIKLGAPMVMVRDGDYIVPSYAGKDDKPFEIWQAGMDAMLIPISILKTMKEQQPDNPFCCIHSERNGGFERNGEQLGFVGEDNYFYHRVRKAGFNIICDPRVQCLHMDLATGKYTASMDIDENDYRTLIPLNGRLTNADSDYIQKRWHDRIPKKEFDTNVNS